MAGACAQWWERLNRALEWGARLTTAVVAIGFLLMLGREFYLTGFLLIAVVCFSLYHLVGLVLGPARVVARLAVLISYALVFQLHGQRLTIDGFPFIYTVLGTTMIWALLSISYGVLEIPRLDEWRDERRSSKDTFVSPTARRIKARTTLHSPSCPTFRIH